MTWTHSPTLPALRAEYCTGQSRCTQHYIALHFIALHCLASLCVPQRRTALLAWPPYQRLQNGPHTHSTLSHHYTPLQSSLHFIHHFNQLCTSTSNSIRAHGYVAYSCRFQCAEESNANCVQNVYVRCALAAWWKKRLQVCTESCVCLRLACSLSLVQQTITLST